MSVEEQTLNFSDINVFIGKTDAGKSIVLRALQALTDSVKFPADTFARHGCKEYSIKVVTDRGVVELIKGRTTCYRVAYYGDDNLPVRQDFNAVGRDVPEKVQFILNSAPLHLSDDVELDVLYQSQHKPFFLISEDRGTFSRVISLISQSDKLNLLEKNVNSDILIAKREITKNQEIVKDYLAQVEVEKQDLKELTPYSSIEDETEKALTEFRNLETKQANLNLAAECLKTLEFDKSVQKLEKVSHNDVDKISENIRLISVLRKASDDVSAVIPDQIVKFEFSNTSERLRSISNDISLFSVEVEQQQKFTSSDLFVRIRKAAMALTALKLDEEQIKKEEEEIQKEQNQIEGQICPICGNIIHLN